LSGLGGFKDSFSESWQHMPENEAMNVSLEHILAENCQRNSTEMIMTIQSTSDDQFACHSNANGFGDDHSNTMSLRPLQFAKGHREPSNGTQNASHTMLCRYRTETIARH
jgi:hypothetical protein